ncbi:MAG: dihydroorotase [Elusimicrobiales bacterium]|nr:dihydroorotase [Elusimicrobiales bacterium]
MILLKNGFFIDPINLKISKSDILINDGKVKEIGKINIKKKKVRVINLENKFVAPTLFDIHVHCRVPGKEYAEDFYSVSKAAIKGGILDLVAMPNTVETTDDIVILKKLIKKVKKESLVNIYFTSAITQQQEGMEIVDISSNSKYVVGFTDDGKWVCNLEIMEEAMKKSFEFGKKVFSHPQIPYNNGVLNEGKISKKFNVLGIPSWTEYMAVWRDCVAAIVLDLPLHLQHLSTTFSVEIVREAKKLNNKITAETCPHYFWFSEDDVKDANFKMNPPLRKREDLKAIINAISEGVIDVIASDHAPHTVAEKSLGIERSPFGVIGLETLFVASVDKLYLEKKIPLEKIVRMLSFKPASICGVDKGYICRGKSADILVFSFEKWKYDISYSKSRNSPFLGMDFKTKIDMVIKNGKILYENGRFFI